MLLRTLSFFVSSFGMSSGHEAARLESWMEGVTRVALARAASPVVVEQQAKAAVQATGLSEAGFQAYLPRLREQALAAGVRPETIDRIFPTLTFSARTVQLDRQQPGGPP
ncbi:MAG TPA: hypothetical protein VGB54_03825, partial [Allosphingosinicella sp.]